MIIFRPALYRRVYYCACSKQSQVNSRSRAARHVARQLSLLALYVFYVFVCAGEGRR